jgi:hypothetical protein
VFGHLIAARADRRLRSESEIAAALGSPMVATVDVPAGSHSDDESAPATGWRTWLRRLVRDDRPWDVPGLPVSGDDLSREIRYRRVLARLRGGSGASLRVLVLVADDDATACRAVAQLAVAAGVGGHTSVVTDRDDFHRMVDAAACSLGTSNPQLTVRSSSGRERGTPRTVLRVVHVSGARPTVPDVGGVSGVLVVVTAGTRTAWELVGIAEACADAGHEVIGAVITHRASLIGHRPGEPTQVAAPKVSVDGDAMAGSA